MGIWYATREEVQSSLEVMNTARSDYQVDSKLEAASRAVEGLLHRRFYPERRTVRKDWPNYQSSPTWNLYLEGQELISLETLTSGGTTIPGADAALRRDDDLAEPPYDRIEISLASSSAFSAGTTFQQAVVITGVFGYNATPTGIAGGSLGAGINAAVTSLVINPSAGIYRVGVGSLVLIGTEYLILTQRSMSDTTVNTAGSITASKADVLLPVVDGSQFARLETILVDAERMRIDDIAGNNLIVTRAWDGTVLAAHNSGVDVYARRTFTALRGAVGSTAAAHNIADPVYVHPYPGLINELCIAEAVVMLEQNAAGYARTVGSGPNVRESAGKGLEDLRASAYTAYGRKARSGAI